jgi:hypothetical protein
MLGASRRDARVAKDVRLQALAYVIRLYDELTAENGAPTLGTQNQAVDFVLANPELRRAVADWAVAINIDEASTAPPQRLSYDGLYQQLRAYLETIIGPPPASAPTGTPHA